MKSDIKEIKTILEKYGMSHNEASIYLSLLKGVEFSVFNISKDTKIPRTTTYDCLESLRSQGFVSKTTVNNVAYFTAESPSVLIKILKNKEDLIQSILPTMQSMRSNPVDTPTTKIFVGKEGIKNCLESILETIKFENIKRIQATSQPDLLELFPVYFKKWITKREDLHVFTQMILPNSAKDYLKSNTFREVKLMSQKFPFTTSITLYGNKMALFSLSAREPYAMIIESKSITDMFKQFFLFTWEMLRSE